MLFVASLALAVFSMLAPLLSSTLWYMPWVGIGGGIVLSIGCGLARNKVEEQKNLLDEMRVVTDLLQETRSLYLVGEGDRKAVDMRLKSDRQAARMPGYKQSQSTLSLGESCDRYDLAGTTPAKEIIANCFAGRDTIYSEARWQDFIERVKGTNKALLAGEKFEEYLKPVSDADVDDKLGFTPIPKFRSERDPEAQKYYLPTYCKQYFEKHVDELGEEVRQMFGAFGFVADVQTGLEEFDTLKEMMAKTEAKKLGDDDIEDISYADARRVLCRLEKCRATLVALKKEHHDQLITKIEEDITRISKLFTEEDEQFSALKQSFAAEKEKIEQLPDQQIDEEVKTEQYQTSLQALKKLQCDLIALEDKKVRKQGFFSLCWEVMRKGRAPALEREEPIPINPALWSRHITQLRLENRMHKVDNKIYWTKVTGDIGPQLVVVIPLLILEAFFVTNPWVCFATFCGGMVALPISYVIELYATSIEKKKRALKMYRDPEPNIEGKKVQMFDPELKQIPGNRPVLRDLQDVAKRYGLDGIRPTASKLMVKDKMPHFRQCKRAKVERQSEDISQVYVRCLKEEKAQLRRLQKRAIDKFATPHCKTSFLAHRVFFASESSLDEKMVALDEAMQWAVTDEARHDAQTLKGILAVEKRLAETHPEEEKAHLERLHKRAVKKYLSVANETLVLAHQFTSIKGVSMVKKMFELKEAKKSAKSDTARHEIEMLQEVLALEKRLAEIGTTRMEEQKKKGEARVKAAKEHLAAVSDETNEDVTNYNTAWEKYINLLNEQRELGAEQDIEFEKLKRSSESIHQKMKKLWENKRIFVEKFEKSGDVLLHLSQLVTSFQKSLDEEEAEQFKKEKESLTETSFQFLQTARSQLIQCQNCQSVEVFTQQLQQLAPEEAHLQRQWKWIIREWEEIEQKRREFFSEIEAWESRVHKKEDSEQLWDTFFSLNRQYYQRSFDRLYKLILDNTRMALRVHETERRVEEASKELKESSDRLPKQHVV